MSLCDKWEYDKFKPATPFQPEYFSGLNWREAEHLVGNVVEFSDSPDDGWHRGVLEKVSIVSGSKFKLRTFYYEYIRTTPETYAHPTITIGGVKLPTPEVEIPPEGTRYYTWKPGKIIYESWDNSPLELMWLESGRVHLTESRAQAWADWWQDTVVKAVQK